MRRDKFHPKGTGVRGARGTPEVEWKPVGPENDLQEWEPRKGLRGPRGPRREVKGLPHAQRKAVGRISLCRLGGGVF